MNFQKYAATANEFINELAVELGDPDNTDRAGRILRSVLHALRARLTPEESLHFIAQLPMLIRALYIDGWKLSKSGDRSIRTEDDFIELMYEEDQRSAQRDFADPFQTRDAARAVFRVLQRHVSPGEIEDVVRVLPKGIRRLLAA